MLRSQGESAVTRTDWLLVTASLLIVIGVAASAAAQAPPAGPQVVSPEVTADRHIVLRVLAPQAQAVRLECLRHSLACRSDLGADADERPERHLGNHRRPGSGRRVSLHVHDRRRRDDRSRNPSTSESNNNSWSLVYVPGSDAFDTKNVPHGSVAEVHYYSTALKAFRRMHVYTPPGYETSSKKYPVFYLLHGAGTATTRGARSDARASSSTT
jgi:enterochelin esterase family protein